MVEVKVLSSGSAFGDLALIDNNPRAATVMAREFTILATLDKSNYKNILSIYSIFKNFYKTYRGKREKKNAWRDRFSSIDENILTLELQLTEIAIC